MNTYSFDEITLIEKMNEKIVELEEEIELNKAGKRITKDLTQIEVNEDNIKDRIKFLNSILANLANKKIPRETPLSLMGDKFPVRLKSYYASSEF